MQGVSQKTRGRRPLYNDAWRWLVMHGSGSWHLLRQRKCRLTNDMTKAIAGCVQCVLATLFVDVYRRQGCQLQDVQGCQLQDGWDESC